jgi:hypothetical protein
MGTREGLPSAAAQQTAVEAARRLDAALAKHKVEHRLLIADGAEHNEPAWANRFPEAMLYVAGQK